jgi:choline dehydrogenase-like flavoprotein
MPSRESVVGDELHAHYALSSRQVEIRAQTLRAVRRNLARIGCWVLSAVQGRNGFSSHYAGTLPYSNQERVFALSPEGRVYGTHAVYVADASGFQYLPTQGLTWTLMANAHRTARRALAP